MRRPIPRKRRVKNYLRIFIVECPAPIDAMEARAESTGVGAIAQLIGHAVHSKTVYSQQGLEEICAYIGSISDIEGADLTKPLCLHISAHGNNEGLLFGGNSVSWVELLRAIQPIMSSAYKGKRILVLSACQADQQKLTEKIREAVLKNDDLIAPEYIFCTTGNVGWSKAAVGWTVLYHLIPNADLDNKLEVQVMLDKIKSVDAPTFVYFRWEAEKNTYLKWPTAKMLAAV